MYPVRLCMNCGSQMADWEIELNMPVDSGCLDIPRGHEKEDDDNPETFRVEGIRPRMMSQWERLYEWFRERIAGPRESSKYSHLYTGLTESRYT